MKRLYGTTDPAEADQIRALLIARGIGSELDRGEGAAPISINVRDEDAPAAAEALAEHFERQEPRTAASGNAADGEKDRPRGLWPAFLQCLTRLGRKKEEPAP